MTTAGQRRTHLEWLLELTCLPTAAGREGRVVSWVTTWVSRRRNLRLRRDRAGNLLITRAGRHAGRPVYLTAHLDHPAFVVLRTPDARTVELEFRGGVQDPYFEGAAIDVFDAADRPHRGRVVTLDAGTLVEVGLQHQLVASRRWRRSSLRRRISKSGGRIRRL